MTCRVWVGEMLYIQQKIIVLKAVNRTKYRLMFKEGSSSLYICNRRLFLLPHPIRSSWFYYQFVCSSYRPAIRYGDLRSCKPGHKQPANIARYAPSMEPGYNLLLQKHVNWLTISLNSARHHRECKYEQISIPWSRQLISHSKWQHRHHFLIRRLHEIIDGKGNSVKSVQILSALYFMVT